MLKTILYYLLVFTTTVRFVDIIYLLSKDNTNLPIPVLIVASFIIIYGVILTAKKFVSTVLLRHLVTFFVIQSVATVFNIVYISIASILSINMLETIISGSFLGLLVNAGIIWLSVRHMRFQSLPFVSITQVTSNTNGSYNV